MKKVILLGMFMFILLIVKAQYTTPGTGVQWTFEDLVANSSGVVTKIGDVYYVNDTIIIEYMDEIIVNSDIVVKIAKDVEITFNSAKFTVNAPNLAEFTAVNQTQEDVFGVIHINDNSRVLLKKAKFSYGKGFKISLISNSEVNIDSCEFSDNYYSSYTSGAINLNRGVVTIENCKFFRNYRAAISSGANTSSTFYIKNSYFEGNVTENSNRPQINIGPCAEGDTTKIIGNKIIGNRNLVKVGGISTSSLLSVPCAFIIENNEIKDNRYGITLTGSRIYSKIVNNTLENNNSQNDPNLGGSGINITASSGNVSVIITGNTITGHLWGITSVGKTSDYSTGPNVNLGNISVPESDLEYNPGLNIFNNNGNNGNLYDLYNNSPIDIMAQNNTWNVDVQDEVNIETVITHKVDDSRYGKVTFMPAYGNNIGIEETNLECSIYPNPVEDYIHINFSFSKIEILDVYGRIVFIQETQTSLLNLSNLKSGIYTLKIHCQSKVISEKIIKN